MRWTSCITSDAGTSISGSSFMPASCKCSQVEAKGRAIARTEA